MTVWWLTVAILAANQVNGNHAQNYRYTPIGSPLKTVCSNTPQTWNELDNLCAKQFPGYRLLQRGYHERFDEVKAQEIDGLIPLRIRRFNNAVYWINDFGLDNEEVGDEYLMDMQDSPDLQEPFDEVPNFARHDVFTRDPSHGFIRVTDENTLEDSETVGALDLADMRWRLVDETYRFARDEGGGVCAVCEMLPRNDVRAPVYGAPSARNAGDVYRVTVRCLEETPRGQRDATRRVDENLLMDALSDILDVSSDDIELESSPSSSSSNGDKEIQFLVLLSGRNRDALINKRLLRDAYQVTGVDDLSVCPAENTTQPAIAWPETDAGNVVIESKLDKIVTSRECTHMGNSAHWTRPITWRVSIDDNGREGVKHSLKRSNPDLSDILHQLASYKLSHQNKTIGLHSVAELLGDGSKYKVYKAGHIHKTGGVKQRTLRETAEFIHSLAMVPVKSRYLDVVAEQLNRILQMDRANISTLGNNPTRLAQDLEQIVTNMVLESGHDTMSVVKSDVALLVANVDNTSNPLSGVSLLSDDRDNSKVNLEEIHDDNVEDMKYSPTAQVSTVVPRSLISASKRIAFTIFSDDKLFQGNKSDPFVLQSRVVNVAVDGSPNFPLDDGEFVEISFKANNKSLPKRCVFWSFTTKTWSMEGCTLHSTNERDVCRCNHLTHFALLVAPHKKHSKLDHSATLHKISIICCCFSLVGVVGISTTLMFFTSWHKEVDSLIVMNLSTALAFNISIYLLTAFLRPKHMHTWCVVLGALLHYSVLVCFCWMFVIASLQVLCLFTSKGACGISYLFCKAFIFAWGIPLIPVGILLALDPHSYKYQSDRQFCYPHGMAFYETVLGPVAVIIVLNAIAFLLVVSNMYSCWCWKQVYRPKYIIEEVGAARRFKTTIFLFFLFGLPWSFGFFAHSGKAFVYIFCLTATLQGFILCAFIVIIEGHTRVLWRRKMFGM